MYKVTGYTDMCEDFEYIFDSFVEAIKTYKRLYDFDIVVLVRTWRPRTNTIKDIVQVYS